jgi:hypothetical protein
MLPNQQEQPKPAFCRGYRVGEPSPLSIGHRSQQTAAPGTQVTVRGSEFDSTTTAAVGVAAAVAFLDESTLTLTIPAKSGPQDIVLTRTGAHGESYSLENGVALP